MVKNLPASAGDTDSIHGPRRSPGEGNDNPLQYSSWEILWTEESSGYSPWGHKEEDMTDLATEQQHSSIYQDLHM